MAPIQKRPRRDHTFDESDEESLTERAVARDDAQRKKAKLSHNNSGSNGNGVTNGDVDNDDESSSDSETEEAPARTSHALPPSTQYEIERDNGFSHLENIEDDDQEAAVAINERNLKEKQLRGDNRAAESGIVEVITCVNFMCHERFEVKLGPLINFVTGKNGSGKSAIVAALQICLGVKASSTNRGTNLKGMIMNGRDAAMVQVQIANRGPDAYLPDQYGKSIIIERNFTRSGGSQFKLKSAKNRTISNKKKDLDDVIEHFQMQVDNPMNILTQDNAKQFITNSGPAEKYKFFVKGTQLEQLDTDYKLIFENAESMQEKVYQLQDNLKILRKRAEEAKHKAELVDRNTGMKDELKRLGFQLAWAQVEAQEQILDDLAKQLDQARESIAKAEREAAKRAQDFDAADAHVHSAAETIQTLTEERTPLVEGENQAKENLEKASAEMRKMKIEQRGIREELISNKEMADRIKADIEREEKRLEDLHGGSHSRKEAEINEAKERAREFAEESDRASSEIPRLQEQCTAAETVHNGFQQAVKYKSRDISQAQNRLQELNSNRSSAMSGYHPNMAKLLNRIQKERWNAMPIGPLGLHCRLLKPDWSDILETTLGGLLNAFVANDQEDRKKLLRMITQEDVRSTVYTCKDLDRPLQEPDRNFDTVLRVLEIDNIYVRNILIVNNRAEQTILIKDPKEADTVLYEGAAPRNVAQCFCVNQMRRGWGMRLTAGSNDSSAPIKGGGKNPRMKTDVAAQVAKQQGILEELRQELRELERKERDAREELKKCKQAVVRQTRHLADTKVEKQRAQDRAEALQIELTDDRVEDGRLDVLKEDLKEIEEKVQINEGSYKDSDDAITEQNTICTNLKNEVEIAKKIVADWDLNISKVQDRQRRCVGIRQVSLQMKNDAFANLEVAKARELKLNDKHAEQAVLVQDWTGQATEICTRVPVDPGQTVDSIKAKSKKLKTQLDQYASRQGGTDQEIRERAIQMITTFREADKSLKVITYLCSLIKQTIGDRIFKWQKFLRHISAHSRMNFMYLLSLRNFRGALVFNHKAKRLELKVEPDNTKRSDKGREAKTLSGGEKSFASICLLLALWEAMGAPLRILDEYDVFMDEVNREVSTKMIITAAQRSVGKQFILITPHQVGKKIEEEYQDVEFIRLPDPRERGQQSLDDSIVRS